MGGRLRAVGECVQGHCFQEWPADVQVSGANLAMQGYGPRPDAGERLEAERVAVTSSAVDGVKQT